MFLKDWFVTNKKASKKFEKFLKNQPRETLPSADKQMVDQYHHHHVHHLQQQHYHTHHPQQLLPPPLQHPLQPLHHIQHQTQFLHPQPEPQLQQPVLHYTPLEPPPGPIWMDLDRKEAVPAPEQTQVHLQMVDADKPEGSGDGMVEAKRRYKEEEEGWEGGVADVKRVDCFAFSGSGSCSSPCEPEAEQRRVDQWSLKRPGVVVAPHSEGGKRQRNA